MKAIKKATRFKTILKALMKLPTETSSIPHMTWTHHTLPTKSMKYEEKSYMKTKLRFLISLAAVSTALVALSVSASAYERARLDDHFSIVYKWGAHIQAYSDWQLTSDQKLSHYITYGDWVDLDNDTFSGRSVHLKYPKTIKDSVDTTSLYYDARFFVSEVSKNIDIDAGPFDADWDTSKWYNASNYHIDCRERS